MNREEVMAAADSYLDNNWSDIERDIKCLVRIPSFENRETATDDAPFGEGPRKALSEVLSLANEMGFETNDLDGYVGYADLVGISDVQIGIIGHVDEVAAGVGWDFEPYDLSIKDNYLVGRGVIDDKGPTVVALHAMKCLKDLLQSDALGLQTDSPEKSLFPYTIRCIFGANEETGMSEIPYYRKRCGDPAFLFTPDAQFPVCYGEKGVFEGTIICEPIKGGNVIEFSGGSAVNAVPGQACARLRINEDLSIEQFSEREGLQVKQETGEILYIEALGKSAHASLPDEGINALALLVDFLLEQDLLTEEERPFFEFEKQLLNYTDGSGIGLKLSDDYFGDLTIVGGIADINDGCFTQTIDIRFPTTITSSELEDRIKQSVAVINATFTRTDLMEPFLIKPEEPEIQALLRAYNDVTGQSAQPFTMGGATYAREFKKASSFGVEMPWLSTPDWAGGMHAANEAISIEQLKTSFRIFVVALYYLEQLELK